MSRNAGPARSYQKPEARGQNLQPTLCNRNREVRWKVQQKRAWLSRTDWSNSTAMPSQYTSRDQMRHSMLPPSLKGTGDFGGPFETTTRRARHIVYTRSVAPSLAKSFNEFSLKRPPRHPSSDSSSASSACGSSSSTCSLQAARQDRCAAYLRLQARAQASRPVSASAEDPSDDQTAPGPESHDAGTPRSWLDADTCRHASRPYSARSHLSGAQQSCCLSETLSQRSARMSSAYVPIAGYSGDRLNRCA
jgi:hypothetical protein